MKRQSLFLLASILFLSLACSLLTGAPATQSSQVRSPFAAQEANAGVHTYWMSPNENGCEASDDLKVAQFRDKEHVFAPDFNTVTYGGRSYPLVGDRRYQSINEDDKPLVLVYSEHGFVLFVYKPGDNPNVNDACLTFSFTLED